jgi:molecular chaperone DnaK
VTEPEAAAIHYASLERVEPGSVIAVYDLGGGTFDAALLRKTDGGWDVLGEPQGIERLGGVDFDEAVFQHVVAATGDAMTDLDPSDEATRAALARLRRECVEAKEALSSDTDASIPVLLPNLQTGAHHPRRVRADGAPALADTITTLSRAMRSAGIDRDDVDAVLLVGGSSRIPLVAELVSTEIGRPVAVDAHPKHLVAMGAARHAAADGHLELLTAPERHWAAPARASVASPVPAEPVPAEPVPMPTPPTPPTPPVPRPEAVAEATAATAAAVGASEAAAQAANLHPADHADPPPSTSPMAPPATPRRPRPRVGLLAGIGAVVVAAVVGAVLVLSGGGDQAVAGCPSTGPFVCITDVAPATGGGLVATFAPIDVAPGASGTSLVFFLADVSRDDHGASVVTAGLPLEWRSSDPFNGWTDAELATRSVVCAGVVRDGGFLPGSGNCRDLP